MEDADARIHFFKETDVKFNGADESWVSVDHIVCTGKWFTDCL